MKIEIEIFKFSEEMPEYLKTILLFKSDGSVFSGELETDEILGICLKFPQIDYAFEKCIDIKKDAWAYAPKLDFKEEK